MSSPVEGETRPLPIDPQIVAQQAQSTIKSLLDAVVELLTNSDDSYRRMGEKSEDAVKEIQVEVFREKGGVCRLLQVSDYAEGMTWDELERAVTFAAPASGFFEGRTVRGLFGRGLKEAIVGLGRGSVWTVRNGEESEVEIFVESRASKYRVVKRSRPSAAPSATKVTVEVLSPRIGCPTFDILYRQLSHHYALRDILQDPSRVVRLRVEDRGLKRTRQLAFSMPEGQPRVQRQVSIEGFGDARVEIFECESKLEFVAGDPGSVAGILVKTEGAILDSRLFGFEGEEAAHYFYGWIECAGIAAVMRDGDLGVLDPNRSGLDWRHQSCRSLDAAVKEILRPLVDQKRREMEGSATRKVRYEYKQKLNDLCRLLNSLVEDELEDLPEWGRTGLTINTLVLRPEVGYAEPGQERTFSVYVPERLLAELESGEVEVELSDVKGSVELATDGVSLQPHKKYEGLLAGQIAVVGSNYGDQAYLIARLGRLEDMAQVKVQSPSGKRRRRLRGVNQGLFRDVEFDPAPDPIQRVSFAEGNIKIYVRFPAVSTYLRAGGVGIDTQQGSLMFAELVAEAFCREVARRRVESIAPPIPGAEIDNFNNQVNQLMLKYLGAIHEALVA
jgi:hypothetical protein